MFQLTDRQQVMLRWLGVVCVVVANTIAMFVDGTPQNQTPSRPYLITEDCYNYLMNHTEYDLPPERCEQQLRLLLKRINRTLEDISNVRSDSAVAVPEDN